MDTTGLFILKDKNIVPYEIKEKKVILCGVPQCAFTWLYKQTLIRICR